MTITIKKCSLENVRELQEISVATFTETFQEQNSAEHFKANLEKAYNLAQLKHELANQFSQFFFVQMDQEVAGYLKVNTDDVNQPEWLVFCDFKSFIFLKFHIPY